VFSRLLPTSSPHLQCAHLGILVFGLPLLRNGFGTGAGCRRSVGKERKRIGRASERTGSRRTWLQLVRCTLVHTGVLFWKSRSDRKGNRGNQSRYSDWRYRREHLSIYTNYVFHMEQVRRDREWRSYGRILQTGMGMRCRPKWYRRGTGNRPRQDRVPKHNQCVSSSEGVPTSRGSQNAFRKCWDS